MSKRVTKQERAEALADLRELLPPGSVVYTILRHRSTSGMRRHMDLYKFVDVEPNGRLHWRRITWSVARALEGATYSDKYDALQVDGAGTDMGFHVVYSLGQVLHANGYTLSHEWL